MYHPFSVTTQKTVMNDGVLSSNTVRVKI